MAMLSRTHAADKLDLPAVTTLELTSGKQHWATMTTAVGRSNQALLLQDKSAHIRKTGTRRRSVATIPGGHTMSDTHPEEPRTPYSGGKAQHADDAASICQHEMPAMLKLKSKYTLSTARFTWSYELQLLATSKTTATSTRHTGLTIGERMAGLHAVAILAGTSCRLTTYYGYLYV